MSLRRPARRYRSTRRVLAIGLVLAALAALLLAVGMQAAGGPRELARSIGFARQLEEGAKRVGLAYPTHALLGTALNGVGMPHRAGAQWVRAAWHAASDAEIERAARGLAEARRRAGGDGSLEPELCPSLQKPTPTVRSVVDRAGLRCW